MSVLYTAPLKALSNEKFLAWTRRFHDKKVLQLTGDTLTSPKIRAEIMEQCLTADIIICTSELLDSVTRNHASEKYEWVKDVELIVVDEFHMITSEERGHILEVALIRLCKIAPQAKVCLLSATAPNVDEFATWLTTLNKKESEICFSTWRPTELRWNFIPHLNFGRYHEKEQSKLRLAVELAEEHVGESTLIFCHAKTTQRVLSAALTEAGITNKIYNANLDLQERDETLKDFESDDPNSLKVIISTSSLAYGVDTSAQNAIIVGVHRGMSEVDELDIIQMGGRAGRFGKSPYGNAYLICDNTKLWERKIANPRKVTSTLADTHALAFHLTAEIANKQIFDFESLFQWYQNTLASIQAPLQKEQIDQVIKSLEGWEAIKIDERGIINITPLGRVSATLYFHPEDVFHWKNCIQHIDRNNLWKSDVSIAYLAAAPTMQLPYTPRNEEAVVMAYMDTLKQVWGKGEFLRPSTLATDLHDWLSAGKTSPQIRPITMDAERITGAIQWIAGLKRIERPDMLKILPIRLRYGVSSELCDLVQLKGVGAVKARSLASLGVLTFQDIIRNQKKVASVMGEKKVDGLIAEAKVLLRCSQSED